MPNKAAHKLVNPLAIGAALRRYSIGYFAGFPAQHTADDEDVTAIVKKLRTFGIRSITASEFALIGKPHQLRSHYRFWTEEYQHLPYEKIGFQYDLHLHNVHFLHIDPADKKRIRYFASEEHAIADRHTSTTLGRYLTQFYNDRLAEPEIRDIAAAFVNGERRMDIRFLTNPNDIQQAYLDGPSSCMSKRGGCYSSPFHPVRVYGNSDLALAVLYEQGRITARGLVWQAKHIHGRLYGDAHALHIGLVRLGYEHGRFDGAKIQRHELGGNEFVVPYIDAYNASSISSSAGAMYVYDDGEHLVLSSRWSETMNCAEANTTSGIVSIVAKLECVECSDHVSSDDVYRTINGDPLCHHCRERYYVESTNDRYLRRSEITDDHAMLMLDRFWGVVVDTRDYNDLVLLHPERYRNDCDLRPVGRRDDCVATHNGVYFLKLDTRFFHSTQVGNVVLPATVAQQATDGHRGVSLHVCSSNGIMLGLTYTSEELLPLLTAAGYSVERKNDNTYKITLTETDNADHQAQPVTANQDSGTQAALRYAG